MKPTSQRRDGFTLLEVMLASVLTVSLAVMLGTSWRQLSRPMSDLIIWGQLFQEMDIAVATLARDLGGSLPEYNDTTNADAPLGGKRQGLLIAVRTTTDIDGNHLQLCFDGGPNPDGMADWGQPNDTVIDYRVDSASHKLIRSNTTNHATTSFTVAQDVDSMSVAPAANNTFQITLNLKYVFLNNYRSPVTRQCVLIVKTSP